MPTIVHSVFQLWHKAVTAIEAARNLRTQIHQTILQVSGDAVMREARTVPIDTPAVPYPLPLTEATIAPLPAYPQLATSKLVGSAWPQISEWSRSLIDPTAEVRFLPWLYIYLDFVLHTNVGGVKPSNKYKLWSWFGREEANTFELVHRVKWFRLLLLRVHKIEATLLTSCYARPSSKVTTFWAHCVCCRIAPCRFQATEHFLQTFKAAFVCGKDIDVILL